MTASAGENARRAVALVTAFVGILEVPEEGESDELYRRAQEATSLLLQECSRTDLVMTVAILSSIAASLAMDGSPEDPTSMLQEIGLKFL